MKQVVFVFALVLVSFGAAFGQKLTDDEQALYKLIMEYRAEYELPAIPLSPSLNTVARTHVRDLSEHRPDQGECNLHSWSDKGAWKACCYTDDHAQVADVWSKPGELTDYQGNGYEIAFRYATSSTEYLPLAAMALAGWKSSYGHNSTILNLGAWRNKEWKAIGVAILDGYAVVWFGAEEDPAGNSR